MKVTLVSSSPSAAASQLGRPALTPELLAACGARYSRNNEGLDAILAKVDPSDPDRSVDGIFRMVDYGHQSIADMAPVAMFIDQISIWMAWFLWAHCPTAGGQESSTRYIRLSADGVIDAERAGIPPERQAQWREENTAAFAAYERALAFWTELGRENPARMAIPHEVLMDDSDKGIRKLERLTRNYAFDRARVFLPVSALTNVMLVMSARGWVSLVQHLLSHPLPEPRALGEAMRAELGLVTPRLLRHARTVNSIEAGFAGEFKALCRMAADEPFTTFDPNAATGTHSAPPCGFLEALAPGGDSAPDFAEALAHHDNRYAWIGPALCRTAVRFGWGAVAFAEIRDLNRHRTGTKYSPQVARGFYDAADQLPEGGAPPAGFASDVKAAAARVAKANRLLAAGDHSFVYDHLLGSQFSFEHTTTADKFVYEAELRTGTGAHYRYAAHLREVLQHFYTRFPETRGLVLEGSAEPE